MKLKRFISLLMSLCIASLLTLETFAYEEIDIMTRRSWEGHNTGSFTILVSSSIPDSYLTQISSATNSWSLADGVSIGYSRSASNDHQMYAYYSSGNYEGGQYYPIYENGVVTKFIIEINSYYCNTSSYRQKIVAHEIGHALSLNDLPEFDNPNYAPYSYKDYLMYLKFNTCNVSYPQDVEIERVGNIY